MIAFHIVHIPGGAHLTLDRADERFHLDADVDISRAAWRRACALLENLGLEIMQDYEDMPEALPDGGTRYWLIEVGR